MNRRMPSRRDVLAAGLSLPLLTKAGKKVNLQNIEFDDASTSLAERSLREYVQQAWPIVEPKTFVPGFHIDAISQHLEAFHNRQIRNLAITVPPRHTKSLQSCVFFPTWVWGPQNKPDTRFLTFSYSATLSLRDATTSRTLIWSDWYQARWGSRFQLSTVQRAKGRYNTDKGGFRVSTSIGGVGTGEGGDVIIVDDPINMKEIHSELARKEVIDWWDGSMPTRLNDPKSSGVLLIMQRGHENDLVGHIRKEMPELFEWLVLPARFESKFKCVTSIWEDPRTKEGELLNPGRFDEKELKSIEKRLGSYAAAAQLQQRPAPAEGGIIKRAWFRYYNHAPKPEEFDVVFQSWDMAFKALKTSSYVCGTVWGVKGSQRFLLDRVRDRLSFTDTLKAVQSLSEKWPDAVLKVIEAKANGIAVMDTLKKKLTGMVESTPTESKEARAFAASPQFEAGNVFLPSSKLAPWVGEYEEALAQFPMGTSNDDMDSTTQALIEIEKRLQYAAVKLPTIFTVDSITEWPEMALVGADDE